MATLKALVYADNKKLDGTYNIKVRLTHKRQSLKISTPLYVDKSQITRSLKFKDVRIIEATEDIIRKWRGYIIELGLAAESMSVKQLAEYIKDKETGGERFRLDFIEYGRSILSRWPETAAKNYRRALNSFERHIGHIDINQITPDTLRKYEAATLIRAPKGVGATHIQRLKAMYTLAQKQFNNPYVAGATKIPHSPFDYFEVSIKPEIPEQRAIPIEYVQKLIDLRLDKYNERLARDLWLLSFGLAGANLADMLSWNKTHLQGGVIKYRRQKIKRLGRKAETEIRVEPQIWPLVNRYRDERGDKLFDFGRKALNMTSHNCLPRIAKMIGYDGILHQYSARHSWATIGCNEAGIDKYIINDALVHTVREMKMTDVYIKKDYTKLWEANAKVLSLLDWSNIMNEG